MNPLNWSLLPDRPREFFQLDESYSRLDLKRRYHELLHIFKPERHPDEFMKIRRAFEELEGKFHSSGSSQSAGQVPDSAWDSGSSPTLFRQNEQESLSSNGAPSADDEPDVDVESLTSKPFKTARDYFRIAWLLDTGEALPFFCNLVEGLKHFPYDDVLQSTVEVFLNEDVETGQLPEYLRLLAREVRATEYFMITTRLWTRLFGTQEFSIVNDLLQECQRSLPDSSENALAYLYSYCLPAALWRGTPEWIDQAFDLLNQQALHRDHPLSNRITVLEAIWVYISQRDQFLARNEQRRFFDNLLNALSVNVGTTVIDKFLKLMALASHPQGRALDALWFFDESILGSLFIIWNYLQTVFVKVSPGDASQITPEQRTRAKQLVHRLTVKIPYLVGESIWESKDADPSFLYVKCGHRDEILTYYRKYWRFVLVDFVAVERISLDALLNLISEATVNGNRYANWLVPLIEQDLGLHIIAFAQEHRP